MPRITVHIGGREPMAVGISKATALGTLDTDAIGRISTTVISGSPKNSARWSIANAWSARRPETASGACDQNIGTRVTRLRGQRA
jgi:hypothetical protein